MTITEATIDHIDGMHRVRMSVRENVLSDPALVTEKDYREMLNARGKGWVCFIGEKLTGFSIVDAQSRNIWALFVAPGFENRGIGRELHRRMLDWGFAQEHIDDLWLTTAPGTRAERFYRRAGWQNTGVQPNGELRFEMRREDWRELLLLPNRITIHTSTPT